MKDQQEWEACDTTWVINTVYNNLDYLFHTQHTLIIMPPAQPRIFIVSVYNLGYLQFPPFLLLLLSIQLILVTF